MRLDEASALLNPYPLALETGVERLEDGVLHVAVRTDMHDCTGEMFEWWFRSRPDTQQYVWWHPIDHVSSFWEGDLSDDTHVGSLHVVQEKLTELPTQDLLIQFRDTEEFFDIDEYDQARKAGAVSAAVLGRTGFGHDAPRDPSGKVMGGRLLHVGRDVEWGLAMRSHFYMGQDLPALGMPAAEVEAQVPMELGFALLQHAYNEFTYLSRFLPSLWLGENRDRLDITPPW
jgi:hypothetical protein